MLAVTTAKRSPMLPDLPAIGETLPGYDVTGWYALFVPAKTPKDIIQKMYTGAKAAADDPDIRKRLEDQGMIVICGTPDQLAAFHKADLAKWGPVIKAAGSSLDRKSSRTLMRPAGAELHRFFKRPLHRRVREQRQRIARHHAVVLRALDGVLDGVVVLHQLDRGLQVAFGDLVLFQRALPEGAFAG